MSEKNNGGPAFPAQPTQHISPGVTIESNNGMSLRDYFAAKALVALFAQEANPRAGTEVEPFRCDKQDHIDGVARISYLLADAMIRAREA